MKKFILVVVLALAASAAASAQDIINFVDGKQIKAKVLEVTTDVIRFKKIENPNGPVYVEPIENIRSIVYENGIVEKYNESYVAPRNYYIKNYDVRYSDIAGMYDTRLYRPSPSDYYSPGWSGVASFFLPGLGQSICGEWGRGLGFLAANIGLDILEMRELYNLTGSYYSDSYYYSSSYAPLALMILAQTALNIWGICDAVNIAKAKNMYFQDNGGFASGVEMKIQPSVGLTPNGVGGAVFAPGVALSFSF